MMKTTLMEKLLSVAEAAARLELSRARVNQLIDSGDLPATRIGRSFVIREVDLELVRERPPVGRPPKLTDEEKAQRAAQSGAGPLFEQTPATRPKAKARTKKPAAKKAKKGIAK